MGKNGHKGVIGKGGLYLGRVLAFAGLLIATNARGEGQGKLTTVASHPSSDPGLESQSPRDSSKLREFVFTSTKRDAELQVHELSGWRVVCVGPCRTRAVVGASYRVSGSGVPTSNEFAVPDDSYPLSLRARAGSSAEQVAGVVMITVGSLSLPASLLLYAIASCSGDCSGASQAERDRSTWASYAFFPTLLGGLVTAAVGVAFLVAGGTSLEFDSGEQARAPYVRLGRSIELTPTGFAF